MPDSDMLNAPGDVPVMMSTIELASYAAMLSRDKAIVPSTLSFTLNLTTATDPLPVIPSVSMIPAQSLPGSGEPESIKASSDNIPGLTSVNYTFVLS